MNKLTPLFFMLTISVLTGCALTHVDATDEDTSAVEFSERLVKGMVNKLDKLVTPLGARKSETEYYRSYHNSFFPISGGEQGVLASLSSYCVKAGGSFRQGACENSTSELLFYAKVEYTGTYSGNRETTMTVIEPINRNNVEFVEKARELGYETAEEQFVKRQRAGENAKLQYEATQRIKNQEAQRILESGRGSKICKVEGNYVYVGFVNDISGDNIQIAVQNIHLKGAPNIRPGGFKPHVTWGAPKDWYIC